MSEYCTNCKTLADLNINQAKTIKEVRELLRQKDIETERLARENAMLHERTKPNTVVLIGNTGHYVNDAVAQHIDQLRQKINNMTTTEQEGSNEN